MAVAYLMSICLYSTIPVIREHLPGRDIQQLRLCPQRQHWGVLQRQRQVRFSDCKREFNGKFKPFIHP